jgi:hypothetical protein
LPPGRDWSALIANLKCQQSLNSILPRVEST